MMIGYPPYIVKCVCLVYKIIKNGSKKGLNLITKKIKIIISQNPLENKY